MIMLRVSRQEIAVASCHNSTARTRVIIMNTTPASINKFCKPLRLFETTPAMGAGFRGAR
jgi:hypothetical protein